MKRILMLLMILSANLAYADITTTNTQAMLVVNPERSNSNNVIQTDPNLSYEMMSNQSGVGRELYLLKAKANNETNSTITAGGEIQADLTAGSTPAATSSN